MPSTSTNSTSRSGDTFPLFLTNIDGCVTEEQISCLVSHSLGAEENSLIVVKKLVPKWKADIPDYAYFKVLVDVKYRRAALQAGTWPAGIKYREFFERPRITWKPT